MSAETVSTRLCTKCGAKIFASEGSCSACLLESGLGFAAEEDVDLAREQNTTAFGDYDLLEEIGRGGQGVVYRARQKSLNRTVALKVIGLGRWAATPHLRRFRQEAEAGARLEHPQIVPIYEIGESDGCCYFSMKLVEGGQLSEVVRQEPMSPRRAAELLVKIARTVQFAHARGILHRDIKPGNILLDRQGEPQLTDFGLARLIEQDSTITNTFDVLGTPSYMAPEQAAGLAKDLTAAADVYSLGAVFYHMLTGQPPFAGGTTYETIRLVTETEPRNPRLWNAKVDVDVATICLKCLEKDPAQRYATAEALADDVERWMRHEPVLARRTGAIMRSRKWLQRNPVKAALAASLAALCIAISVIVWKSDWLGGMPNDGIAVLPFENLSDDRTNTVFADGVQDDILTKLAKVAALRVISRTTTMQYRDARNLAQIADALRVSYALVGSVRRTASRVHVNTQLIDVRTDTSVWAEEFDRDLIDIFAVQSEIARKVAERLHAKMTPEERQSIERAPTADLTAFDLYMRGRNIFLRSSFNNSSKSDLVEAANFLEQAVARDPSFFAAYCQLAELHDYFYTLGHDHSPARRAQAAAAVQAAARLQPDAGETHLARAHYLYDAEGDNAGALAELKLAEEHLPNEAHIFELRGYIVRRMGRQEESGRNLERAVALDPGNTFARDQFVNQLILLRRYADAEAVLTRSLANQPNDPETRATIAWIDLEWKADPEPLQREIDAIRQANSVPIVRVADGMMLCALARRDATAANEALIAAGPNASFNDEAIHFSHSFMKGLIARMSHDDAAARVAFMAARDEQETLVRAQPDFVPPLCVLGLIDAALGRNDEALREGRRALDLVLNKDGLNGPLAEKYLALIAAWAGEKDLACEQLAAALRDHGTVSYGYLKLLPFWDPLRGDPRFEKMVASLAPK